MLTITICVGSSCYMRGSDELAAALEEFIDREALGEEVELVGSFCMGECSTGISIRVGERQYREIRAADARSFFYGEVVPRLREKRGPCCLPG
jgi:NADH:ubiquinone oxidoreductase subunit E